VWGREYDLDVFHIVAVEDFNMGAMENKSLNIFNSSCVLASAKTTTDGNFEQIESIIAHEYFHNWTGNRITCRDWFQLSLKEGLTVFRDQQFSSDIRSRTLKRIETVKDLRNRQFGEDKGKTRHPVRPESYVEINNFYTATIYNKGAEIINMTKILLGLDDFMSGVKIYFDTFDGQAVTIDDWVWAMEMGSGKNLTQFKLWYSKSGTPHVDINESFKNNIYKIQLTQSVSEKKEEDNFNKPFLIPIKISCLCGETGKNLKTEIVELKTNNQEFVLGRFEKKPVLSFNQSFSAPITFCTLSDDHQPVINRSDIKIRFLYDINKFNRWQAGVDFANILIKQYLTSKTIDSKLMQDYVCGLKTILDDNDLSDGFKALCLSLPSVSEVMDLKVKFSPSENFFKFAQYKTNN
jgi:aminopeptidase N